MSVADTWLGVDVGGTKTRFVLVDDHGVALAAATRPTPAREGRQAMLDVIVDGVRELGAGRELTGVGVGAAGVIDRAAGRVVAASDSFDGWAGTDVAAELEPRLGVAVSVDNDVTAFLAGEAGAGAVQGVYDALGITLGTGVGGAVLLDGRIVHGRNGAAGEIGHVPGFGDEPCTCGQRGHLEAMASGRSIARRYGARVSGREPATASVVAELARRGDPDAVAVFEDAGRAVGRAILIVAGLLDVHDVVIGGGVSASWDLIEPSIRLAVWAEPPVSGYPVRIERSRLGGDAAAIGAALLGRTAAKLRWRRAG